MAGSVNKVILLGNLGQDPEVRQFGNGGQVCNLRIATSESWKDKQSGERKERTEWHRVVIFKTQFVHITDSRFFLIFQLLRITRLQVFSPLLKA